MLFFKSSNRTHPDEAHAHSSSFLLSPEVTPALRYFLPHGFGDLVLVMEGTSGTWFVNQDLTHKDGDATSPEDVVLGRGVTLIPLPFYTSSSSTAQVHFLLQKNYDILKGGAQNGLHI